VSQLLIHKQVALHGSWVTSVGHMAELLEHLVRWDLHPEAVVTHRFPWSGPTRPTASRTGGGAGKVCIVFD
jgi:threonine dehydrogenase-like Zn-dependent dehydrogenase